MEPQRIQLSRKSGFNLQEHSLKLNGLPAVMCARPSKWGNPFVVRYDPHTDYTPQTNEQAVNMFRAHIEKNNLGPEIQSALRGKNLACWCRAEYACHCDALLEIANKPLDKATRLT